MKTTENRFWNKVRKGKPNECWSWLGARQVRGYGNFYSDGKRIGAHRYSWQLHNNSIIPKGHVIMHTCDNPNCVNPRHLALGTQQNNMIDAVEKGNVGSGYDHYNASVPDELAIQAVMKYRNTDLTLEDVAQWLRTQGYDVTFATIHYWHTGRLRKYIAESLN